MIAAKSVSNVAVSYAVKIVPILSLADVEISLYNTVNKDEMKEMLLG